jgi:hypothetical protein
VNLAGNAGDTALGPRARCALNDAISALRPHSAKPTIGAAIEKLESVADESRGNRLERALTDISGVRLELRRSAAVSPQLRERVENAYRDISHEYLLRHSEAYASATARAA